MQINLLGKRALVCGSTQGIGKASALALAKAGADISLMARNADALKRVKEELDAIHRGAHHILIADFSNTEEVKHVIDNYVAQGNFIDVLVNNTGGPPAGPISEASADAFVSAFNLHLVNNHQLSLACIPGMKQHAFGRIINIISTSVKQPLPNLGVSNTVRAAVGSWAKTMANELGRFGITVNNVLPGATATARLDAIFENKAKKTGRSQEEVAAEMLLEIPAQRFAKAEDIAAAVVFLASEQAAYINGINVPVDGGRTTCL